MFPCPHKLDYAARLKIFELEFRIRTVMFDLSLCYKIISGFPVVSFDSLFTFAPHRSRRPWSSFSVGT